MTGATRNTILAGAAGLAVCVFLYVVVWMSVADPDTQFARERRLCDREVAVLLNSRELVDVVRAAIVVNEVNCSIGRRLPKIDPTASQE